MTEEKSRKTVKRTSVKRATKKATAKRVSRRVSTKTVTRKAAPRHSVAPERRRMSFGFLFVALLLLLGLATVSLYFGYSDEGQINVAKQIEKNAGTGINGDSAGARVPAAPTNDLPNSGMVPSRRVPEPTPVVEEAQAASADETASSTDEMATTSAETAADITKTENEEAQTAAEDGSAGAEADKEAADDSSESSAASS